jgi:hypothetical protein
MAAEYALSGGFEPRSDLFALGVLLYESLAGRRPFIGNTDLDTLHRIMKGEHPPLASLCPTAPTALVSAIERLLRPEPQDRFPNAAALLDALVDVAPPPTARRILGQLVIRAAEDKPWNAGSIERVEGTVAISDAVRLPEPVPALPGAQTRTRVPSEPNLPGLEAAVLAPAPRSTPPPSESLPETKISSLEEAPTRSAVSLSNPAMDALPAYVGAQGSQAWKKPIAFIAIAAALLGLASLGIPLLAPDETNTPESIAIAPLPPMTAQPSDVPARSESPSSVRSAPTQPVATTPSPPMRALAAAPPAPTQAPAATPPAAIPPLPVQVPVQAPRVEHARDERNAGRETRPSTPSTEANREPSARERATSTRRTREEVVAESTPTPESAAVEAEEERREASAPARLRITVTPWGDVWIDGRPMGRAPIDVPLAPGTHRIGVGAETPSQTRTVRLRAGETQQLDLDLAPP